MPEAVGSYATLHFLKATLKWFIPPSQFSKQFCVVVFSSVSSVRRDHGQCVLRPNREPWGVFHQFSGTTSISHSELQWGSDKHSHWSFVGHRLLSNCTSLTMARLNIWVGCVISIFNQFDQILLQSRNQLKLVGSHIEQANEMVMEW